VKTEKLSSTDAFVVYDIDDAPTSVGIVRSAPKILQSGATWLARSMTYTFAFWERQVGGASAGINAAPDARAAAVKAFVTELTPAVAERRLLVDAAKGVDEAELAPLRAVDPRPAALWTTTDGVMLGDELDAISAVTAAAAASGGLDGKKVAIEGFGPVGLAAARLVEAAGGTVVAVATADGTVATGTSDAAALAEAWASDGQAMVASLGDALITPSTTQQRNSETKISGRKKHSVPDAKAIPEAANCHANEASFHKTDSDCWA
jgi:glutamate dehydrogenase/leucine dehydrogenase